MEVEQSSTQQSQPMLSALHGSGHFTLSTSDTTLVIVNGYYVDSNDGKKLHFSYKCDAAGKNFDCAIFRGTVLHEGTRIADGFYLQQPGESGEFAGCGSFANVDGGYNITAKFVDGVLELTRRRKPRITITTQSSEDPLLPENFPTPEETEDEEPQSHYKNKEHPCIQKLKEIHASGSFIHLAQTLLDADEESLTLILKALVDGMMLHENEYPSQAEFREAVEEWKKKLNNAVMMVSGYKYEGRLNFGDALYPYAVGLILVHFAPYSCIDYNDEDFKEFWSKFCKIARANACMSFFDWILPKSLNKEAGRDWTDETKKEVSKRMSFVDGKFLVTVDTDNHQEEFETFCSDNGITMAVMDLIGLLLITFHVKHHELGKSSEPLSILVTSAPARDDLFSSGTEYFESGSVRFLSYVTHGQNWATRTIKNIRLYPPPLLRSFSVRLVCFFRAIARDIGNPRLFCVSRSSLIAEKYAGIADMTDEDLQDRMIALSKITEDIKALSNLFDSVKQKMEEAGDEVDLLDLLQKLSKQIPGISMEVINAVTYYKQVNELSELVESERKKAEAAGVEFDANELLGKISDDKKVAYSKGAVERVKSDIDTRPKQGLINQANKRVRDGLNRGVDEIRFSEYECCSCSKDNQQYRKVCRKIAIDGTENDRRRTCLLCKQNTWLTSSRHYRRVGPITYEEICIQRESLEEELNHEKKHNKKNGKRKRV